MNMPGCTWAYTAGQRVVHILKGNVTLCRRRLRNPVTVRAVQPDVLIQYSGDDCLRCLGVFNALICEPEPTEKKDDGRRAEGEAGRVPR